MTDIKKAELTRIRKAVAAVIKLEKEVTRIETEIKLLVGDRRKVQS